MPATTVAPQQRHGKANLFVSINGRCYTARKIRRHHWALTRPEGAGSVTYHCQRQPAGGWDCTCPDHLRRHTLCKHLGALFALGLLPRIRGRKAVANG
jgi:hypothetical protein